MTSYVHPDIHVTLGATQAPVQGGEVTLDQGAVPYATASIVLPLTPETALDDLDPRDGDRAVIHASNTGTWTGTPPVWTPATPRTFDLGIRSRVIDHAQKTVDLTLASDEALLQDYASLTDDYTPYNLGGASLREIVNYVLNNVFLGPLAAGGPDADVRPYWSVTNLHRNPAVVGTTLNFAAGGGGTLSYLSQGSSGVAVYTITGATGGALFLVNTAKYDLNCTPGLTYTCSTAIRTTAGTASANVNLRWLDNNGATIRTDVGAVVANIGTGWVRVQSTFTAPANAVKIAPYSSISAVPTGRVLWYDGVLLYEGDAKFYVTPFTGADSPNNGYTYAFQGPADDSPSVRTPDIPRDPSLLVWEGGVSAWDFLQPLLTMAGLRLYCDEHRVWRLIYPEEFTAPGFAVINGSNATYGRDEVGREDAETFSTGVLVRYAWKDSLTGASKKAYDAAGTPDKVFILDYASPYPGPGAAKAILDRRNGIGRVLDVEGLAQWQVSPGMDTSITMPGMTNQQGKVASVTFNLEDDGLMRISTRGLIDIPVGSWAGWDPAQTWAAVADTVTWASLP